MSLVKQQLMDDFTAHASVREKLLALTQQKHLEPYQVAAELLAKYYAALGK
jgi:hypothetical protein